ncbi:MAG: hypothetical protein J0L55_04590 [Caulobacterales bacterium]|nr:hypothetical protein [Caulobacterales bacterium]MCA0371476.1 hypothetical protein [Pseudomonadota bacterium]
MFFGKKKAIKSDKPEINPPEKPNDEWLPWYGKDDYISCNFAYRTVYEKIKALLTFDGRLHAETLMVAIGALVGACAFQAVYENLIKTQIGIIGKDYVTIELFDGRILLAGDELNSFLVQEKEGRISLFQSLATRAIGIQMPQNQFPDINMMFKQKIEDIINNDYNLKMCDPEHSPQLQPVKIVDLILPHINHWFAQSVPSGTKFAPPSFEHRPVILNLIAGIYLEETSKVLSPEIGMKLAMEAAIITSKLGFEPKPQ